MRERLWRDDSGMKTNKRQGRLFGWSVRFGIAAVAVAFAASGFAGPGTDGSANKKNRNVRAKAPLKDCYVILTSSPFPQPLERLGPTPSTASPMSIIGEPPVIRCRR